MLPHPLIPCYATSRTFSICTRHDIRLTRRPWASEAEKPQNFVGTVPHHPAYFELLDNCKYRIGKATDEESETCFKIMHQNLIESIAERQEKFNLEHSMFRQKIEFPKYRLVVIPHAVYCGHYSDETRAVVTCCWITSLCAYIFTTWQRIDVINPLNPELNPICSLLALLAHHFLHVSRIRVTSLTLRLLMSYIYIWSTYS